MRLCSTNFCSRYRMGYVLTDGLVDLHFTVMTVPHSLFKHNTIRIGKSQTLASSSMLSAFQFCGTMPDAILELVSIIMQLSADSLLLEDFIIPVPTLSANSTGVIYVSFTREAPGEYVTPSFSCVLKFVSKEADPEIGRASCRERE